MSQPSSGLDKRQVTLQLCIGADGEQNVKPALIFRGKGRVATEEKEKYNKKVDVYFQQDVWKDEEINLQWVQGTFIPGTGNDKEEKNSTCRQCRLPKNQHENLKSDQHYSLHVA